MSKNRQNSPSRRWPQQLRSLPPKLHGVRALRVGVVRRNACGRRRKARRARAQLCAVRRRRCAVCRPPVRVRTAAAASSNAAHACGRQHRRQLRAERPGHGVGTCRFGVGAELRAAEGLAVGAALKRRKRREAVDILVKVRVLHQVAPKHVEPERRAVRHRCEHPVVVDLVNAAFDLQPPRVRRLAVQVGAAAVAPSTQVRQRRRCAVAARRESVALFAVDARVHVPFALAVHQHHVDAAK
mmetsp:Transcript_41453/g.123835  ORF Transcript_41453/g.123835 Transcript_41453/m.123835 type:complete len:241 (+) Transcript_41453:913-1635(+)